MRANRSLAVLLVVGVSASGTTSVLAQDARLVGVFVNAAQSEQSIKTAIEAAADEFNFLIRPIARSRLRKTNPNITRVEIARSGAEITVALGTSKPSTALPGGLPVKWSRDGEAFDLSLAWQDSTLVQSFSAADGKRINRYRLSTDGNTLSLEITLTSDALKKPLNYTLTFTREN